jgi:parvulin-like peptidyl-prolyl isomerase
MSFASRFLIKKVNPVRRFVVLFSLLALVAAACSGGDATVATVNGAAITLEEVEGIRVESSATNRDQFNQDLFQLIVEETVRQAAVAQFGIVPDPVAIDAQFDQFMAGIEAQGPIDEYMENNGITEETIRHVALQQVMLPEIQDRLVAQADPFSEDDLRAAYEGLLPSLSTVCTRHILVETEDEAAAVIDRLDGGEEFADLAAELSIDTGSGAAGGDIGCISDPSANLVSTYAAASLEAEIGEVTGPVPSEFGFHVLIVDSREVQAFDEIRAELEVSLVGQRGAELFDNWVFESLGAADVEVTERYGTWQTEPTFGVSPPA